MRALGCLELEGKVNGTEVEETEGREKNEEGRDLLTDEEPLPPG